MSPRASAPKSDADANVEPTPLDAYRETHGDDVGAGHIALRLARVQGAMERLGKSGVNEHFKYRFVTDADIRDAVRPLLAAEGVYVLPNVQDVAVNRHLVQPDGTVVLGANGKPTKTTMTHVSVLYTFVCDMNGFAGVEGQTTQTLGPVRWDGIAFDTEDKGLNKAYTACRKTFDREAFNISTGDDPDQHGGHDTQATATQAKTDFGKRVWGAAKAAGFNVSRDRNKILAVTFAITGQDGTDTLTLPQARAVAESFDWMRSAGLENPEVTRRIDAALKAYADAQRPPEQAAASTATPPTPAAAAPERPAAAAPTEATPAAAPPAEPLPPFLADDQPAQTSLVDVDEHGEVTRDDRTDGGKITAGEVATFRRRAHATGLDGADVRHLIRVTTDGATCHVSDLTRAQLGIAERWVAAWGDGKGARQAMMVWYEKHPAFDPVGDGAED